MGKKDMKSTVLVGATHLLLAVFLGVIAPPAHSGDVTIFGPATNLAFNEREGWATATIDTRTEDALTALVVQGDFRGGPTFTTFEFLCCNSSHLIFRQFSTTSGVEYCSSFEETEVVHLFTIFNYDFDTPEPFDCETPWFSTPPGGIIP